ncbi:hypothetical protein GCM10009069_05660 [Algimonas arctica]|uniref:ABC transporter domain-containing protein n=1 Tax=Algimonas arctica TaxID=1479486 RepID=A0A8J3G1D9_9PROT|nr:ATP-binding cassette domain-containing protein [Algimonas arctica]GHA85384.1 hypothetical protein GCM10009069_05660 [Algimonas arctica]
MTSEFSQTSSNKIVFEHVSVHFPLLHGQSVRADKNTAKTRGGTLVTKGARVRSLTALNNVSFRIGQGERVGIMGENGSGKTTLLRTLCGIYYPHEGEVRIRGRVSSMLDLHLGFDNDASGRDNIWVRGRLLGYNSAQIESRIPEILEFSQLGTFLELKMKVYSSGMRMRLAFAIATSFPADNLIMDEWLSAGDKAFRSVAEERMVGLVESSGSLVIATHNPGILRRVCQRGIILHRGAIIFDGACEDAIEFYQREIVLGGRNKRELAPLVGNAENEPLTEPTLVEPQALLDRRLSDLESITAALHAYFADMGHYPTTEDVWFGIGRNRLPPEEWIPGLVSSYLDEVPRDPAGMPGLDDPQYIYKSDGEGFKLLALKTGDVDQVRELGMLSAIDPKRPWAYGSWTEGYADA